jgi:hypothetical protein
VAQAPVHQVHESCVLLGPKMLFTFQQKTGHLFFQPALLGADFPDLGLDGTPVRRLSPEQVHHFPAFMPQVPAELRHLAPVGHAQLPQGLALFRIEL